MVSHEKVSHSDEDVLEILHTSVCMYAICLGFAVPAKGLVLDWVSVPDHHAQFNDFCAGCIVVTYNITLDSGVLLWAVQAQILIIQKNELLFKAAEDSFVQLEALR